MAGLSTHVLDAATGSPAVGLSVQFFDADGGVAATKETNDDGRITFCDTPLEPGVYRLVFDTGTYFSRTGTAGFYPEVAISFQVADTRHHHVPLLLSPYAYSTYRGS